MSGVTGSRSARPVPAPPIRRRSLAGSNSTSGATKIQQNFAMRQGLQQILRCENQSKNTAHSYSRQHATLGESADGNLRAPCRQQAQGQHADATARAMDEHLFTSRRLAAQTRRLKYAQGRQTGVRDACRLSSLRPNGQGRTNFAGIRIRVAKLPRTNGGIANQTREPVVSPVTRFTRSTTAPQPSRPTRKGRRPPGPRPNMRRP